MSSENKELELTNRHQLIDLNKDRVNFKVSFNVVSDPVGQEFQAIVMNQNDLDNYGKLNEIEMKTAPGKIGGTIVADNNKYQNYFLILKANGEAPVKVNLSYTIEDIPPREVVEEDVSEPQNEYNMQIDSSSNDDYVTKMDNEKPIYKNVWFWVIFLLGVGVLIYMSYDYIKNRRDGYHNQIKKALATTSSLPEAKMETGTKPMIEPSIGISSEQQLHDQMTKMVSH